MNITIPRILKSGNICKKCMRQFVFTQRADSLPGPLFQTRPVALYLRDVSAICCGSVEDTPYPYPSDPYLPHPAPNPRPGPCPPPQTELTVDLSDCLRVMFRALTLRDTHRRHLYGCDGCAVDGDGPVPSPFCSKTAVNCRRRQT
jgi:hypothetical protein